MVSYRPVERANGITFDSVKEALTTRGYLNSDLKTVPNGRNSLTMKDVANCLFIKVYPDSTLMLNSVIAQQLIEDIVFMPRLLFYSKNEDKTTFIIWELMKSSKVINSSTITSVEIGRIANTIYQIHKQKSTHYEYGPHFPADDRRNDWKSYLKFWTNHYISDSPREIEGFEKDFVLHQVMDYIDFLPMTDSSPCLLHGDINIANFLSKKNHIYTTDLDYSIFGDPAWEFASAVADWKFSDPSYHDILKQYMNLFEGGENEKTMFLKRVEYYGPIKKIGLLYRIGDVSELSTVEEMSRSMKEIKAFGTTIGH